MKAHGVARRPTDPSRGKVGRVPSLLRSCNVSRISVHSNPCLLVGALPSLALSRPMSAAPSRPSSDQSISQALRLPPKFLCHRRRRARRTTGQGHPSNSAITSTSSHPLPEHTHFPAPSTRGRPPLYLKHITRGGPHQPRRRLRADCTANTPR